MGMFDYFEINTSLLPTVPSELMVRKDGYFVFQTKDTEMRAMSTYIQNASGRLILKNTTGEFVPGEPVGEDADFFAKLNSIGSYVVKDTWYEEQQITDTISFYTSLRHPKSDNSDRYVYGWVEYSAKYECGSLQGITLKEYTPPKEYTDDELAVERLAKEKARAHFQSKLITIRKENPTPEQHLIDSISAICRNDEALYDETDLIRAINSINNLIEVYREKHDPHYRPT